MSRSDPPSCLFCEATLPRPATRWDLYNPEGALCGRCACGAAFVVDETGKMGGQALLDLQALLCDGDLDRALKLESNRDVEVVQRPLAVRELPTIFPRGGLSQMGPRIWFGRLIA